MIDPLETGRQALADFGVEVIVRPADFSPEYPLQVLFSPRSEDTALGQARGTMLGPVFRADPDMTAAMEEGDIVVHDGAEYAVFETDAAAGRLTRILTVERPNVYA